MHGDEPRHERFHFLTGSDLREIANRRRTLASYIKNQRLARILLDEADELDRRAAEASKDAG
jgi:hypothetical protein